MPAEGKRKVLLVQPLMGGSGEYALHPPLSLLYVASAIRDLPVEIEIFDLRLHRNDWQKRLEEKLADDLLMVGLTIMGGTPVENAIQVSKKVRAATDAVIVWGGSLALIAPGVILSESFVDFTISGSGIEAARSLVRTLLETNPRAAAFEQIPGLGFKTDSKPVFNKAFCGFEPVHFSKIPYDLIADYSVYGQIGSNNRVFPIYSAHGCPYQCNFCISPATYRDFPKKWVPISPVETADHIEFLVRQLKADEIYFYDDDSFVNPDHIRSVINGLRRREIKVRLSFRGARINELMLMDNGFLEYLAEAGTNILHVGVESGTQRILDLFNKRITTQDIVSVNRKLAQNNRLIAGYNWIIGNPTETDAEIIRTARFMLRLIKDNPRCIIFPPNMLRPIPGTKIAQLAAEHGYKVPQHLTEWVREENESDLDRPWLKPSTKRLFRMLHMTSFFVDNKDTLLLKEKSLKNSVVSALMRLYRPLAKFRFKSGFYGLFLEEAVFNFFNRVLNSR